MKISNHDNDDDDGHIYLAFLAKIPNEYIDFVNL